MFPRHGKVTFNRAHLTVTGADVPLDDGALACTGRLSEQESAVLRGVADGVPLETIADIDGMSEDEVAGTCRRALSIVRHPATAKESFTEDELAAAAILSEHPSLLSDWSPNGN